MLRCVITTTRSTIDLDITKPDADGVDKDTINNKNII